MIEENKELDQLRARGVKLAAVGGWICFAALGLAGWALGSPNLAGALLIAGLVNILPTVLARQGRFDREARLVTGTLAAIHPALLVFLMRGHPWQMEGHMYFLVALAALVLLCDWRPIALATILIAAHHLVLDIAAPAWVFTGAGNLGRVLFHVTVVGLQFAILAFTTARLRQLMIEQSAARQLSERMAAEGAERNLRLEEAIATAERARRDEAAERTHREHAERAMAEERQQELLALAAGFEASIAGAVNRVSDAVRTLGSSAGSLNGVATEAARLASSTAASAAHARDDTQELARQVIALTTSIDRIADQVQAQTVSTNHASGASEAVHRVVGRLGDSTSNIATIATNIDDIARRTNRLALNAAIEAARAGESGRGFAVVANEVKILATQAQQATSSIHSLAATANDGAETARGVLDDIVGRVEQLAATARLISGELDSQRRMTNRISAAAEHGASSATDISDDMGKVADVAVQTEQLAENVKVSVSELTEVAQSLRNATREFVTQLRAA